MADETPLSWIDDPQCLTCEPARSKTDCDNDTHEAIAGQGLWFTDPDTGERSALAWWSQQSLIEMGARVAAESIAAHGDGQR